MLSRTNVKSAMQSRTIQASTVGAIVSVLVLLAGLVGLPVAEADVTALITAGGALVTLVTSIIAILARIRATATIA